MTQYETISLPQELGEEIEVEVDWTMENDGIGPYEYWGHKCFDKGENYLAIENVYPVFTDQSQELQDAITRYIDDNFKTIIKDLTETMSINRDY
jgi:hypothetical protein